MLKRRRTVGRSDSITCASISASSAAVCALRGGSSSCASTEVVVVGEVAHRSLMRSQARAQADQRRPHGLSSAPRRVSKDRDSAPVDRDGGARPERGLHAGGAVVAAEMLADRDRGERHHVIHEPPPGPPRGMRSLGGTSRSAGSASSIIARSVPNLGAGLLTGTRFHRRDRRRQRLLHSPAINPRRTANPANRDPPGSRSPLICSNGSTLDPIPSSAAHSSSMSLERSPAGRTDAVPVQTVTVGPVRTIVPNHDTRRATMS